jgi:parallel beta-helix repeat protein
LIHAPIFSVKKEGKNKKRQKKCCVYFQIIITSKLFTNMTHGTKQHHQKSRKHCKKHRSEHIRNLDVCKLEAKKMNVTNAKVDALEAQVTKTESLYINDKKFPTSTTGTPISETTVITAPGKYVVTQSFVGKITIQDTQNVDLNLANLTVSNDNGPALEIVNCEIVWVHGGFLESSTDTAVVCQDSYNPAFRDIYTLQSPSALRATNCNSLFFKNWFIQNVTDFAISIDNCPNTFSAVTNVSDVTGYAQDYLIRVINTDIFYLRNFTFQNIVGSFDGVKSDILVDNCFDLKLENFSSFTNEYNVADASLQYNIVSILNCGDVTLTQMTVSGDALTATGASDAKLYNIRIENSYNVSLVNSNFADNSVTGDENATNLELHNIHVEALPGASYGCTNYQISEIGSSGNTITGGSDATSRSIRMLSANGRNDEPDATGAGNWSIGRSKVSGLVMNDGKMGSVCGIEILNFDSMVRFYDLMLNNNGNEFNAETCGLKALGTYDTLMQIDRCQSNENQANDLVASLVSSYNNTNIFGCSGCNNNLLNAEPTAKGCFGALLPGSVGTAQLSPKVYNSTFSVLEVSPSVASVYTYGVYAGAIDLGEGVTSGVSDMTVINCACSNNSNGYGIFLKDVSISDLEQNTTSLNDLAGICVQGGDQSTITHNNTSQNTTGIQLDNVPYSSVSKNLSSNNDVGFVDTTAGGNAYLTNESINDISDSYSISGGVIPVFELDRATGNFNFVSGNPVITAYTNIIVV